MRATRKRVRELAERTSSGTVVRLFWLQGTRELWVEVCEPEFDVTLVIPAEPERALEAFHHPYGYAAAHRVLPLAAEPLAAVVDAARRQRSAKPSPRIELLGDGE